MDLLSFERKLDSTIMRKRLDIQEALKRPMKQKRKLRIFISNTAFPAKEPEAGPSLRERSIEHMYGPYRVSGGWWKRLVERDYYYAETGDGDLLWLFYDRPRKRWFLHGVLD